MKCEKCKVEMDEGFLSGNGFWVRRSIPSKTLRKLGMVGTNAKEAIAYRCPKCKKLEFYTE